MDHRARREASLRHVPQFLQADAELRRMAAAELMPANQFLGEMAAHAIREDRHLGADVGAGLDRAARLPRLADAAIARAHADDAAVFDEHGLAGEAHEQIGAGGLDLARHPLHEVAERDHVVAVIGERRRRDRQAELPGATEQVDAVVGDLAGQWRALGGEVGHQLGERGRIEQRAGERMRARLTGLVDHCDRQGLAALLLLELRKAQRGREAGRAGAHDQDVDVEGLAFHGAAASTPACR